jgi:hypothetical protein
MGCAAEGLPFGEAGAWDKRRQDLPGDFD